MGDQSALNRLVKSLGPTDRRPCITQPRSLGQQALHSLAPIKPTNSHQVTD
jgi:hypothetical protein